jgi:hypothetical protein
MSDDASSRRRGTQRSWDEVGRHFAEVGRRVSDHYRKLGEQGTTDAAETNRSVSDALQTVMRQMDQALTSVGNAIRDPEAKDSLNRAVRSLGDALSATFSDVSDEIRTKIGTPSSTKGERGPAEPSAGEGPPASPPA